MDKFKRYMIGMVLLLVVCGTVFVCAQSDLLTGDYSSAGWAAYYNRSESVGLPEGRTPHTVGWAVKTINFQRVDIDNVAGGTVATHDTGMNLPDNAIIMQGIVDVITPTLPLTSTVALNANSAADMLAATTNFNSVGIKACIPVDTAASAVKLTAARDFTYTVAVGTVTQGVVRVYLKYYQGL